jgi:hypothetical protein
MSTALYDLSDDSALVDAVQHGPYELSVAIVAAAAND